MARKNFIHLCMVVGKFVPPTTIPTSVKFRDFAELHLCSFLTYHSQTWGVN